METEDEIKARHEAIRNGNEAKPKLAVKIINSTRFREICHQNDVKISEEALKEFARMNQEALMHVIDITKEMEGKVILRRYVESVVG